MHRQWLKTSLACAALLGLLGAGCGDDDDDDAASDGSDAGTGTTAEAADLTAYCDAEVALETAPAPDVDFATASEDEIAAAMSDYASEVMRPLAEAAVAVVPEEITADTEVLMGALGELEAGDPAAWDRPEVAEANDAVHQFDLDNCGWGVEEVTASEYGFDGLPDEIAAGLTSFEFTNDGNEVHELLLVRKNDGVTQGAEELLSLPEEEAMELVTMQGEPAFALPGQGAYAVFDLEPGEYIALCFIPVGMTSDDGPPPEGPPHAMQGMVAEFTVT